MPGSTIGEVAKRAGVGVETIRYYERRGLIPRPPARRSGYRQYPDDTVDRLAFIRHAKDLGFTLTEIGELLSLRTHPRSNCIAVKAKAEAKIADVESRIEMLGRMRVTLKRLVAACDRRETTEECPILESLKRSAVG